MLVNPVFRLSNETIKPIASSDNIVSPLIDYYNTNKILVKFNGSILRQAKVSYIHLNIVNIYIVYELGASTSYNNDPTLKNRFFDAVTLAKNADIDNASILVM